MAAVYKVGKKWRADWTDNEGKRRRERFKTKGEAEEHLDRIKAKIRNGTYVAPQQVWLFGALADSWMTNRIEQSRTRAPVTGRQAFRSGRAISRT